jgi:phosphatidylglycerol lysyltransferase
MLRASLVATLGLGAVAVFRLLQPPRPLPTTPAQADMERARAIVRTAADASGHLALLGDKSLLFSESGATFLMYGVAGRSRVSMGDPVGAAAEHAEMVWRFRELCDREGGWCVFYEVRPENLASYVDAGLSLTKIGEEGRVALPRFSLEGSARAPLRQAVKRAEREGAVFRVVPAAGVPELLPQLRAISDDWLAAKSAAEKGFSLGFFHERYLRECPCAVVEQQGRPVAFANLWAGENRNELSIDLMRYGRDAPKGVMDYLFVQIMLWGRAQGYAWFSLGMAPLAGLEDRRLAPAWHKLGRLVYRYGENFYNFEGLRQYKDKFLPDWRPRYLATPSGMVLPRVLLDVTALISRGPGGARGDGLKGMP